MSLAVRSGGEFAAAAGCLGLEPSRLAELRWGLFVLIAADYSIRTTTISYFTVAAI
jgi:hypothetical protein